MDTIDISVFDHLIWTTPDGVDVPIEVIDFDEPIGSVVGKVREWTHVDIHVGDIVTVPVVDVRPYGYVEYGTGSNADVWSHK